MRLGYSLLHAEQVLAEDLDYGDCAKYQVVCPNCREALFKRVREVVSRPPTHYLAHYHSSTAEERDCEMRVNSMVHAHLTKTLVIGRGQTLDEFTRTLHEAIVRAQANLGLISYDLLWGDAHRIMARPDLATFSEPVTGILWATEGHTQTWRRSHTHQDLVNELKKMPPFRDRSPFWLRRQASYGLDLLTHVTTSQGERTFKFLVGCAYSLVFRSPESYPPPDENQLDPYATRVAAGLCHGCSPRQLRDLMRSAVAPPRAEAAGGQPPGISADELRRHRRTQLITEISDKVPGPNSLLYRQATELGIPPADGKFAKAHLLTTAGGPPFYKLQPREADAKAVENLKVNLLLEQRRMRFLEEKKMNRAERRQLESKELERLERYEKIQFLLLALSVWSPFVGLICAVEARIER